MKKGDRVSHPIYGIGQLSSDPESVETNQWTGIAAWCVFFNPQTAIAACWPYMVPVSDLTSAGHTADTTASVGSIGEDAEFCRLLSMTEHLYKIARTANTYKQADDQRNEFVAYIDRWAYSRASQMEAAPRNAGVVADEVLSVIAQMDTWPSSRGGVVHKGHLIRAIKAIEKGHAVLAAPDTRDALTLLAEVIECDDSEMPNILGADLYERATAFLAKSKGPAA